MSTMTLEQAIAVLNPEPKSYQAIEAWKVVRARLAQPAQAVDVGAIREVIDRLRINPSITAQECADSLAVALTSEKAGRVDGNTLPIDIHGKWVEVPIRVQLHIIMLRDKLKQRSSDETLVAVYDAVSRSNITRDVKTPDTKARIVRDALSPASPAPDKEGL